MDIIFVLLLPIAFRYHKYEVASWHIDSPEKKEKERYWLEKWTNTYYVHLITLAYALRLSYTVMVAAVVKVIIN